MKLLFVGYSPNSDLPDYLKSDNNYEQKLKLQHQRTELFSAFLKSHFDHVGTVYAEDYLEQMSDNVDVTIFDALPPTLKADQPIARELVEDPLSGVDTYQFERYLSESFDKPVILIGETSGNMGRAHYLLLDNLCLCLASHGLNPDLSNELFNSPKTLTPVIEHKSTPYNFKSRISGLGIEESLPFYRIQTESFKDNPLLSPGAVATGKGFNERPDAEVFAGGDNAKGADSVALGRHGNYFQWGFSVTPDLLTSYGQDLFVNAVHYISKFNGQKPQTRKLPTVFSRYEIEEMFWGVGDEGYGKESEGTRALITKMRQEVIQRKEKGEELSPNDEALINMTEMPAKPRNQYIPRFAPEFSKQLDELLGDDWNAYTKFFEENKEYIRATGGNVFTVDKDMKELALSNRDVASLEALIGYYDNNQSVELMQTLLNRYTGLDHSTAKQWRSWFEANKDKLYFSDTDGYIFIKLN